MRVIMMKIIAETLTRLCLTKMTKCSKKKKKTSVISKLMCRNRRMSIKISNRSPSKTRTKTRNRWINRHNLMSKVVTLCTSWPIS
jgi:hypothetical protein